jgi:protein-S-isoprenylcysteine O-methyltransferase Ste14
VDNLRGVLAKRLKTARVLTSGWVIIFKQSFWVGVLLGLLTTTSRLLTARVEEGEDVSYFGTAYLDHMKQVNMFIPYLF